MKNYEVVYFDEFYFDRCKFADLASAESYADAMESSGFDVEVEVNLPNYLFQL